MRVPGWELRLAEAVEAARNMPFVWGQHDCAIWAFDVRRVLTGVDGAAAWRGRYRTAAGAHKVMRRLGWGSLAEGVTAQLGAPLATPLLAQRGDIVLGGTDPALGVCLGAEAAFLLPVGLTGLPITEIAMAWRV
jgi:hypothetical protein